MEVNDIFLRAENYVRDLFKDADSTKLVYHNLDHTQRVVNHANEIAAHYNLIEADHLVVVIAAWFHDTGYLITEPDQHEAKSVELMKEFMQKENQYPDLIRSIEECILATRWPVHPVNLLQQILVDADTYNLGTKDFFITNEQVYQEQLLVNDKLTRIEWVKKAIKFLEKHEYFTQYCKDKLQERKRKNIKKLKKDLKALQQILPYQAEEKVPSKSDINQTTKGVQTMLRLTSSNHLKLSEMADGKANILISVNAIIISVILTVLLRKLQVDAYLTIPTLIFLFSSVTTIVVAILATRPKMTSGVFNEKDIADKKTNLLFFGNFYKMSPEEYERSMKIMMDDADYLYSSLVTDIYQLGLILARKYWLIRLAYNIFMIGIIASVIAFALAVMFNSGNDAIITNAQGSPL